MNESEDVFAGASSLPSTCQPWQIDAWTAYTERSGPRRLSPVSTVSNFAMSHNLLTILKEQHPTLKAGTLSLRTPCIVTIIGKAIPSKHWAL
jgi:hypothetical protein